MSLTKEQADKIVAQAKAIIQDDFYVASIPVRAFNFGNLPAVHIKSYSQFMDMAVIETVYRQDLLDFTIMREEKKLGVIVQFYCILQNKILHHERSLEWDISGEQLGEMRIPEENYR